MKQKQSKVCECAFSPYNSSLDFYCLIGGQGYIYPHF